jgi:hypothetical protein
MNIKSEYIKRKALLKKARELASGSFSTPLIISAIEDAPTADVVEVVRCKDCVWWYPREYGSAIGRCENPYNGLANEYIEDDDFCSFGERKEGAEE